MMKKITQLLVLLGAVRTCAVAFLGFMSISANASLVTGGTLLSSTDADQLETWLGVGDQDFTNIWTGTAGISTASQFHSAVDGAGATFSIYEIIFDNNDTARIGGYTSLSWGDPSGHNSDSSAFIFNLDSGEAQFIQVEPQKAIYLHPLYFSNFGGGYDLFGGNTILGSGSGTANGYDYSHSYDLAQGRISISGDSGQGWTTGNDNWAVSSLEVYTFSEASAVPIPAAAWLFGSALLGVVGFARRRSV